MQRDQEVAVDGAGGEQHQQEAAGVRKGPWTMEEDLVLVNYIAANGEGAWNNLARAAGLNRTGKSCRLRWLNYLRPDVRRGNISPEEHALIVELQSRWGNRWSKIARHLPGRTDNEIKNFWRTKIHKRHKNSSSNDDGNTTPPGYYHDTAAAAANEEQSSSISGQTLRPSSLFSLLLDDHQGQGYDDYVNAVHGGGDDAGGGGGAPSEFMAASSENFWALEDFWPTVQSLHVHGNC